MLILNKAAVSKLLDEIPINDILANQAQVFNTLSSESSSNQIQSPHRTSTNGKESTMLFMPSSINGETSIKVVGLPKNDPNQKEKRSIEASSMIFDSFGKVEALMDSSLTTGIRTAAGSIISTMIFLPPSKSNPEVITIFGGGLQAFYHAKLLISIYSKSLSVVIYAGRDSDRTGLITKLSDELQKEDSKIKVRTTLDVEDSVRKADIICCCTPSIEPLFKSEWVKAGTHLTLIGSYKPEMQEVEPDLIRTVASTGRLVVDTKDGCEIEAGDLIKASVKAADCVELGSLIEIQSREGKRWTPQWRSKLTNDSDTNGSKISLYKSVGFGAQDVAISRLLLEKCRELQSEGLGVEVDF